MCGISNLELALCSLTVAFQALGTRSEERKQGDLFVSCLLFLEVTFVLQCLVMQKNLSLLHGNMSCTVQLSSICPVMRKGARSDFSVQSKVVFLRAMSKGCFLRQL